MDPGVSEFIELYNTKREEVEQQATSIAEQYEDGGMMAALQDHLRRTVADILPEDAVDDYRGRLLEEDVEDRGLADQYGSWQEAAERFGERHDTYVFHDTWRQYLQHREPEELEDAYDQLRSCGIGRKFLDDLVEVA